MAQILLIDKNSEISKVVKLNLMKSFDFEVIEKNNVRDGIELCEILPNIDLILLRTSEVETNDIKELIETISFRNSKIPLILISDESYGYQYENLLPTDATWQSIVEAIGKVLNINKPIIPSKVNVEYVPIPISYFFNINETSIGCDVYIRVKKGESDFQYIKRLNSTDYFNRIDIERYANSGLKEFYVTKEHFPNFVNFVTDKLTLTLASSNAMGEAKLQVVSETFDVTVDRIHTLGVDERTVELVQESVKTMEKMLESSSALGNFLKNLQENKLSFAYSHSYFTCMLLQKILKNFEWESASAREKITIISYFHDISLKNGELMKISSTSELENAQLSKSQKELVLNHAYKSAEILDQFPAIPMGVSVLVREHHGIKSGVGFRSGLSIGVSPMAMMFMVVEEFVHEFLKYPNVPNKDQIEGILTKMELEYNKLTYAQTMLALRNTILPKK